jgi:hypothetical protein
MLYDTFPEIGCAIDLKALHLLRLRCMSGTTNGSLVTDTRTLMFRYGHREDFFRSRCSITNPALDLRIRCQDETSTYRQLSHFSQHTWCYRE